MNNLDSAISKIETRARKLPTINPTFKPDDIFTANGARGQTINFISNHYRTAYNEEPIKRPRFTGNVQETCNIIIHLAIAEMTTLRERFPHAWQKIYKDTSHDLYCWTNRQQIATMAKGVSKRTISNHIKILIDAGVISYKQNARIQTIEEQKAGLKKTLDPRGRGNFRLWVNRDCLMENTFETPKIASKMVKIQNADNQCVTNKKEQKLHLSSPINSNKLKINNNNCGKGIASIGDVFSAANRSNTSDNLINSETAISSSTPLSHKKGIALIDDDIDIAKRSSTSDNLINSEAAISNSTSPTNTNRIDSNEENSARNYFKKFRTDDFVKAKTPKNERSKAARYLMLQLIGMIYPEMPVSVIEEIEKEADWMMKNLIEKTMNEFNVDEKGAFDRISRGIYLAHRWSKEFEAKNGKKWNFKRLLPWLSAGDTTTNTLWSIVKKWVPEERRRLNNVRDFNRNQIRWESIRVKIDSLVRDTLWNLENGLYPTAQVFTKAKSRLKMSMTKLKVPAEMEAKYLQELADRITAALAVAKREADVNEFDTYDRALIALRGHFNRK